jgi:hypothetical protein
VIEYSAADDKTLIGDGRDVINDDDSTGAQSLGG